MRCPKVLIPPLRIKKQKATIINILILIKAKSLFLLILNH